MDKGLTGEPSHAGLFVTPTSPPSFAPGTPNLPTVIPSETSWLSVQADH